MLSNILTTVLIVLLGHLQLAAQCKPALPSQPCNGSEPLVIANEIIHQGTTKYYYGPVVTINSLTMNGGKLVVCGDLTIDKFYMDSGQIIINPGARFVIGSGIGAGLELKGKSEIYNYGTLECQRNLSLQGGWATPATPNIVMNIGNASVFRMPNQYLVINNPDSWFINGGTAQCWGIITDNQASPSSVCLGIRSVTQMAILINKVANAYTVSVGSACVYVFQFSQHFGPLTNIHNLFICLSASHTSDAGCIPHGCTPNNWGAAQVFTNCNTCASLAALPSGFTSFALKKTNDMNQLIWELDREVMTGIFYIEQSGDGYHYSILDSLEGGKSKSFSYTDRSPAFETQYYRIRYVEKNSGQSVMSKTITSTVEQNKLRAYPSPFTGAFYIRPASGEIIQRILTTGPDGRVIPVISRQEGYQWRVEPLNVRPNQLLIVQVVTNMRKTELKVLHK
jgi:hypothetical protein